MASCYSYPITPRDTAALPAGSKLIVTAPIGLNYWWNGVGIRIEIFNYPIDLSNPNVAASDTNCWVKVAGTWRRATMSVLGA